MKKIILLLLTLAVARAQTIVTQKLVDASGRAQPIQVTITWPNFVTASGIAVAAGSMTRSFPTGQITIPLYPTVGATPSGVLYSVTITSNGVSSTEFWDVPVSSTPVLRTSIASRDISSVVRLNSLTQSGAQDGQAIFWNDAVKTWQPQPVSYAVSGAWSSYSTGSISATAGTATIDGSGTSWTAEMVGWWLTASSSTRYYKVKAVDVDNQVLTLYDSLDADILVGTTYSLTQPMFVPASTHGLNSANVDATCKNPDGAVNNDIVIATFVDGDRNVEVVFYGAFTGLCILRR